MNLRRFLAFLLVIVLLSILSIIYPNFTGNTTISQEYPKETAILSRVIDGDTIELDSGEHVRLLGINTPEKNMPFSNESKLFLKKFENKTITLDRDNEDVDKYKRKLRYIYYENRFLNLEILEQGFANSYYTNGLKYETQILRAEEQAKLASIGIWTKSQEKCAVENCMVVKKIDPQEEFFIIQNICSFDCNLDGWFVKDAGRNVFYLKTIKTNEEQTYSSTKDVWNNEGDRFFMFDKQGLLVIFYEY